MNRPTERSPESLETLEQVHRDNAEANQFGVQDDGISPSVAEKTGYKPTGEDVDAIVAIAGIGAEPTSAPTTATETTKRYELPGVGTGHVNPDDQPVRPADVQKGLTEEEIRRRDAPNKRGAALAREVLSKISFDPNQN